MPSKRRGRPMTTPLGSAPEPLASPSRIGDTVTREEGSIQHLGGRVILPEAALSRGRASRRCAPSTRRPSATRSKSSRRGAAPRFNRRPWSRRSRAEAGRRLRPHRADPLARAAASARPDSAPGCASAITSNRRRAAAEAFGDPGHRSRHTGSARSGARCRRMSMPGSAASASSPTARCATSTRCRRVFVLPAR